MIPTLCPTCQSPPAGTVRVVFACPDGHRWGDADAEDGADESAPDCARCLDTRLACEHCGEGGPSCECGEGASFGPCPDCTGDPISSLAAAWAVPGEQGREDDHARDD